MASFRIEEPAAGTCRRRDSQASLEERLALKQAPIGDCGAYQSVEPGCPGRCLRIRIKLNHGGQVAVTHCGLGFKDGRGGDGPLDLLESPAGRAGRMSVGIGGSRQSHGHARLGPLFGQPGQTAAGVPVESLEQKLHCG